MAARMRLKSAALLLSLEVRFDRVLIGWVLLSSLACAARIATSPPLHGPSVQGLLPLLLLIVGPVASVLAARRWFADGDRQPQPNLRFARVGRWRQVSLAEAQRSPLYGNSGIMVSLLVGILMNIPVRALEYLGAMPAVSGPLPAWLLVLHTMLSFDVVLMTSLYAIAFVAALKRVPLFPRLLVTIWWLDLCMQLVTSSVVGQVQGLPADVAFSLQAMLHGNVVKVLISVGVWFPYLLLSRRVNLTFRARVPA